MRSKAGKRTRGWGMFPSCTIKKMNMAHPWKSEDLTVEGEPEDLDEYFQKLVDNDDICEICGDVDDTGDCACSWWDDDCWVNNKHPYTMSAYDRIHSMPRLTAKGKRLRAEARAETIKLIDGLERRGKVRKARRRWMVVKDTVDKRRIALFWQEQTQRALCAPSGAGRAADAAAFASEFQGESA